MKHPSSIIYFTVKSIFMAEIFKCFWYLWKDGDPELLTWLFKSQYRAKNNHLPSELLFSRRIPFPVSTASPVRGTQMEETLQKYSEGKRVKWVRVGCSLFWAHPGFREVPNSFWTPSEHHSPSVQPGEISSPPLASRQPQVEVFSLQTWIQIITLFFLTLKS